MIVSETPKRSHTRWLQACVLLCAMVVLPLGIASAQDYEAVGRRLRAAVGAGELTGEQARAMLGALKKEAAKSDANLESIWKKLQAMVRTRELTEEQANAMMSAIKTEAGKKDQDSDRAKAYLMKVKKDLGAAVEAGTISREDAAKRYEAAEKGIRERMAAGGRQSGSKRITREDYARAEAELRKAVGEGKISGEAARARLGAMRNMMAEPGERQRITREDWEGIRKRIEGAVESGRMTREEADAKYREIREQMSRGDSGGDRRAEYEGFERRIKAAVEAGKMTREEAAEMLEAYKKRLDQER